MQTSRSFLSLCRTVLIPSLLAGIVFIPAQAVTAAEENTCSIAKIQDELIALRDSTDADEREAEELALRVSLLKEIIDCALLEIDHVDIKLSELSDLAEEELVYREQFVKDIAEYRSHYTQQKESISDEEITSIDVVKERAKEILEWRDTTYNSGIDRVVNFIFLTDGRNIRKTAYVRLEKITAALEKINLTGNASVQDLLATAQTHIQTANDLQNEAYDTFLTTLSTSKEEQGEGLKMETSTTTPVEETATTTDIIAEVKEVEEKTTRALIHESFDEIRGAYASFLEISSLVKTLLGL